MIQPTKRAGVIGALALAKSQKKRAAALVGYTLKTASRWSA